MMRHTMKLLGQQARRIQPSNIAPISIRHAGTLVSPLRNNNPLLLRIATALDQKTPVVQALEQWREQGNQVKPSDLRCIIKKLQDSEHFSHALQISEWMSSHRVYTLFPEDVASRVLLIDTVLGLKEAERFFETIPETMKDYTVYTTLLTLYARNNNTLDKAEAVFEKMRDLGFLLKPTPYNLMLSLYSPLKRHGDVNNLLTEMEDNNVEPDDLTANHALLVYAAVSDIKAMEKFLSSNQRIKLEWGTCIDMAKAYLKSGSTEKSLAMLHRTELLVDCASRKPAYEALMSVYGDVGEREDVYRIWELHKNAGSSNEGYRAVISALSSIGDMEGAEVIYREWELGGLPFDASIPNTLISGYHALGMERRLRN
ncbi:Tetratricopeptide repeat (TPR)-like superfamily protein [Raphanus sativus]|uniref:Pentatricopeptide repeat-containing protein At1g28020 n=1 Tax=Raphanus sativus TaxID=3726 RepID=A0A6J0MA19_RAPSA|nr:putative pentatricopeptide repeat-containing protein At1g28020 [Raphanus sativus]KAJ4913430.1 Tetratricopeptide repeat (TPR)-like superfamily protein [Raphanus sativus]